MDWFEIVEVLTYDLNEFKGGNDEYIDKSSVSLSQFFNYTWLRRYPHPRKVVSENGSEFKREFTTFIKDFDIKSVLRQLKTHKR